ncbi:TetR/AcrR family transcriptional regulator [Komagataeibacter sp. FNDCF1]|uniref:TetR/AcrR family transcriptional regulator n=1 Tax=Komagataeibacter sp. FNDCF1 TaxID=2878681 RepID=UPI001E2D8EA6|nr:TetR/AcrR family transcriptional regulator [Komagataeibacter sp. FNDCF1]MCE2564530.1 TetR/AcrR family transcriptional regulator [Komagataeibacter sp. FNDCF1]
MALSVHKSCGRPSIEGTEELDRAVLDIATQAFLADGYAATAVERIARMVGCSKATIYRRYSSKEELFKAVVRERCQHLVDAMHEASLSPSDPVLALRQLVWRFLEFSLIPETVETYRVLIADGQRIPALLDSLGDEIGRTFYEHIISLLGKALGRGDKPEEAAWLDHLAHGLTGMIAGWPFRVALVGRCAFATEADKERFFDTCWSVFETVIQTHQQDRGARRSGQQDNIVPGL